MAATETIEATMPILPTMPDVTDSVLQGAIYVRAYSAGERTVDVMRFRAGGSRAGLEFGAVL